MEGGRAHAPLDAGASTRACEGMRGEAMGRRKLWVCISESCAGDCGHASSRVVQSSRGRRARQTLDAVHCKEQLQAHVWPVASPIIRPVHTHTGELSRTGRMWAGQLHPTADISRQSLPESASMIRSSKRCCSQYVDCILHRPGGHC